MSQKVTSDSTALIFRSGLDAGGSAKRLIHSYSGSQPPWSSQYISAAFNTIRTATSPHAHDTCVLAKSEIARCRSSDQERPAPHTACERPVSKGSLHHLHILHGVNMAPRLPSSPESPLSGCNVPVRKPTAKHMHDCACFCLMKCDLLEADLKITVGVPVAVY
jgi:hypothetical protein